MHTLPRRGTLQTVFADLEQEDDVVEPLSRSSIAGVQQERVIGVVVLRRGRGEDARLVLHVERQDRIRPERLRDELRLIDEDDIGIEAARSLGKLAIGKRGERDSGCQERTEHTTQCRIVNAARVDRRKGLFINWM